MNYLDSDVRQRYTGSMARAWRIEFEGAFYHILSRGNEGRGIVGDDTDRRKFLETLGQTAERFDLEIFAYVLMTNHYHLLLRTRQANLSNAMQWFGTAYTRRYNNRHGRTGHLFQGRFKSILVENEAYLMRLSFYIHRNPVRAGLVQRLADYPWSSYKTYAYGRAAPEWLSTGLILAHIQAEDPHKGYREQAQKYVEEEARPWENLRHGVMLGSREFVERIRRKHLPPELETDKPQQRAVARGIGPEELARRAASALGWEDRKFVQGRRLRGDRKLERDLVVYWLWNLGWYKNEEIGRIFGLTSSAVSHCVQTMRNFVEADGRLRKRCEALYSQCKV
jgi:REP element-mobilizing transposase RayT